jgi:hypothetical protein
MSGKMKKQNPREKKCMHGKPLTAVCYQCYVKQYKASHNGSRPDLPRGSDGSFYKK